MKNTRQLEKIFKGVANQKRIKIVLLVDKNPGISLIEISNNFSCSDKTIFEHVRKLVLAGLVNKKYRGAVVEHFLSPYGKKIVKILKTF